MKILLKWQLTGSGSFSIKSLEQIWTQTHESLLIWKAIWKSKTPSKVFFFLWTACRNRIPTIDLLGTRGMCLTNVCSLCLANEESAYHILMSCAYAREVWSYALKDVGHPGIHQGHSALLENSQSS